MSTHNIGFYEDLTKLFLKYHQIRALISSAVSASSRTIFEAKMMFVGQDTFIHCSRITVAHVDVNIFV